MIIVSACLLGQLVRYKGDSCTQQLLLQPQVRAHLMPCCPECDGGLPTPRPPAEIQGAGGGATVLAGKAHVVNSLGKDVTIEYCKGAQRCLELARKCNARAAILKQRSPSCGSRQIYDGSFSGRKIDGMGVTAALLTQAGITVYSEEELTQELLDRLISAK
jgi:uncharacterized protein YbbK (DUF523 family)